MKTSPSSSGGRLTICQLTQTRRAIPRIRIKTTDCIETMDESTSIIGSYEVTQMHYWDFTMRGITPPGGSRTATASSSMACDDIASRGQGDLNPVSAAIHEQQFRNVYSNATRIRKKIQQYSVKAIDESSKPHLEITTQAQSLSRQINQLIGEMTVKLQNGTFDQPSAYRARLNAIEADYIQRPPLPTSEESA